MRTIKIESENGLHARPASLIVNACLAFESEIFLIKGETKANARSIMNLMAMGIVYGDEISVLAEGNDSEEAESKIVSIIEGAAHD
jgi:phosphotransferase system HPr (HPr) family protein